MSAPQADIGIAIVICTYRRPALLRAALASLAAQDIPAGVRAAIYVIDNSDDGSARAVASEAAAESRLPIRWLEAHPANISVARNAGVRASAEPFVAFIDDDQTCRPGWLAAVAAGLRTHPHDVFFGGVEGVFEAPERATAAGRQLFSRQLDLGDGQELFAFGPRKLSSISLATANSVFRRATALADAEPFDPAFGHGGGEDFDLFCRLQRQGRRFAWLPGAVVREFVPAPRCDGRYLRRRFYAGGQAYAYAVARGDRRPGLARWLLRLKAAAQALILLAQTPRAYFSGREIWADHVFRWAGVFGKLSFGGIYPLYRG